MVAHDVGGRAVHPGDFHAQAFPEFFQPHNLALFNKKSLTFDRVQTSFRKKLLYFFTHLSTGVVFAAVVLGLGRIFGETMIALMATGNAAMISMNPFDSVRTLSATIGAEMAEVVFGDTHYNVLFLIGSLLFIFTFALNALAEFYFKNLVVRKYQSRK